MKRRVVVTGLGAVTPIGNTVDEMWQSIDRLAVEGDGRLLRLLAERNNSGDEG